MSTPMINRARRRRRGRGADRWSDGWLLGMFAFWTFLAVVERDWNRALSPAIFLVGFAGQVLLKKLRRPTAATALVAMTIAAVFVVSIVQRTWFTAVVMGIALLVLAGIWGLGRRPGTSGRAVDDAS